MAGRPKGDSICSKRCASCVYHGVANGGNGQSRVCCDYILVEGHSRGCNAGPKCNKYKKGTTKDKHKLKREAGTECQYNGKISIKEEER